MHLFLILRRSCKVVLKIVILWRLALKTYKNDIKLSLDADEKTELCFKEAI